MLIVLTNRYMKALDSYYVQKAQLSQKQRATLRSIIWGCPFGVTYHT